jgi:uncharacterized RDD family membrane protein YckC
MNFQRKLRLVQGGEPPHYPKASLRLRFGARAIDAALAFGLFRASGNAGALMAMLYLLFCDGMFAGQSIGKKIFGVKVIHLPSRLGARHRDSFLRNAPLAFVVILSMLPEIGVWAFWGGLALVGTLESLQVLRDPNGIRLGDTWAQTQVIDGKDLAEDEQAQSILHRQPAKALRSGSATLHSLELAKPDSALQRNSSPP